MKPRLVWEREPRRVDRPSPIAVDRRVGPDFRSPFARRLDAGGNPLWWSLAGVVGGLAFCLYLIWAIVLGAP